MAPARSIVLRAALNDMLAGFPLESLPDRRSTYLDGHVTIVITEDLSCQLSGRSVTDICLGKFSYEVLGIVSAFTEVKLDYQLRIKVPSAQIVSSLYCSFRSFNLLFLGARFHTTDQPLVRIFRLINQCTQGLGKEVLAATLRVYFYLTTGPFSEPELAKAYSLGCPIEAHSQAARKFPLFAVAVDQDLIIGETHSVKTNIREHWVIPFVVIIGNLEGKDVLLTSYDLGLVFRSSGQESLQIFG